MKPWLSLGERLSPAVKATLTAIDVDYTLEASAQNESEYFIRPGKAHAPAVVDPLVSRSLKWTVAKLFASSSRIRPGRHCHSTLSLAVIRYHSVFRDLHTNLAAIAVVCCQNDSAAPG